MGDLILYIARALVDHPDEVEVNEADMNRTVVVELRVAQDDIGKVIGKQGRMARALRTLLAASCSKVGKHSHLDIVG